MVLKIVLTKILKMKQTNEKFIYNDINDFLAAAMRA